MKWALAWFTENQNTCMTETQNLWLKWGLLCFAEKRDTVSRLMEEYEAAGGGVASPAPAPPSHTRHAPPSYRARPRVPAATPITNFAAVSSGVEHQFQPAPISPASHISVPYSPPMFLG